jgi:hypothetical protein
MSTDYGLKFSASDGTDAEITILDSINPLPGSDTWTATDPSQWDIGGGSVSSWGSGGTYLSGPVGVNSIYLERFGKSTAVGDTGAGNKNYDDGSFPSGSFQWECVSKS